MEALIVVAGIFIYFTIGAFFAGVIGRAKGWSWDEGDDAGLLVSVIIFWPFVLPILVVFGAHWIGKKLVSWSKGEKA